MHCRFCENTALIIIRSNCELLNTAVPLFVEHVKLDESRRKLLTPTFMILHIQFNEVDGCKKYDILYFTHILLWP